MKILFAIILTIHICSGTAALLSGLVSVLTQKGSSWHKRSGRIFYFAMFGVSLSSFLLAIIHPNMFLFCLGVFALYQNYAGISAIKNKSLKPKFADLLVLSIGSLNSVYMIFSMNVILTVFGVISTLMVIAHWRIIILYRKQDVPPMEWLKMHIRMIMGAYIAAVTAFLVVNLDPAKVSDIPSVVVWTTPTFVLGALGTYYKKKYVDKRLARVKAT